MKKLIVLTMIVALAMPSLALAQKKVNEYGEELSPDMIEQIAPMQKPAKKGTPIQESTVGAEGGKAPSKAKKSDQATAASKKGRIIPLPPAAPASYAPTAEGREKRFQVGLIAPGFAYVSRGYGPAMTFGLEADYYFFEKLSAGLRFETETKFKSPTILSFVPHARYVFDLDNHPRWALYAQAGVGVAVSAGSGTYVACDIAIPAGGFWWQWTDQWSFGAETSLHIYARSNVAVGWNISPAVRYMF